MVIRELSAGNWISKTEKSEMNRGSTGFRAPPGGPIAAENRMSRMFFQLRSLPRSNRPLRSITSFRSAMGCWVP